MKVEWTHARALARLKCELRAHRDTIGAGKCPEIMIKANIFLNDIDEMVDGNRRASWRRLGRGVGSIRESRHSK